MVSVPEQESLSPEAAFRDADKPLPCSNCGYDLRGTPLDARCPECNAPCAVACRTDTLAGCDPAWLGRIVRGARLVSISMGTLLLWFVAARPATAFCRELATAAFLAYIVVPACIAAAFGTGMWRFTAPPPRRVSTRARQRGVLRVAAIFVSAGMALTLLPDAYDDGWWWALELALGPFGLAGLVMAQTFGAYASDLAARAGDGRLAREPRALFVWYAVSWVICVLGVVVGNLGVFSSDVFFVLAGLAVLISGALLFVATPFALADRLDLEHAASLRAWQRNEA